MTRKVIEELLPSTDKYEIRERMAETTEAVSVIMKKGRFHWAVSTTLKSR